MLSFILIGKRRIQPGDVPSNYAKVTNLSVELNYKPNTSIKEGIFQFIRWYKQYYLNEI